MENTSGNAKWVRGAAIILLAFGILHIPYPKSDTTTAKALLEVMIGVSAFAVIPIVSKLWPIPGERNLSIKRWTFLLGMVFIGDTVIRFQDDFFPRYPSSAKWVVTALFVLTGLIVLSILSRDLKKGPERSVTATKADGPPLSSDKTNFGWRTLWAWFFRGFGFRRNFKHHGFVEQPQATPEPNLSS